MSAKLKFTIIGESFLYDYGGENRLTLEFESREEAQRWCDERSDREYGYQIVNGPLGSTAPTGEGL